MGLPAGQLACRAGLGGPDGERDEQQGEKRCGENDGFAGRQAAGSGHATRSPRIACASL